MSFTTFQTCLAQVLSGFFCSSVIKYQLSVYVQYREQQLAWFTISAALPDPECRLTQEQRKAMSKQADTTLRRLPERGGKDFELACAIIDAAKICHVGFVMDDQPYVLPMACARDGSSLLLHGSVASRLMKQLAEGLNCCVTVTHLDGIVLARSAFHSSMNYRSVMIFGNAIPVKEETAKMTGLDILVEHLAPGRLAELRKSTRKELNATLLLSLPIETFTTKVRTGPPSDASKDLDLPLWAGVIPLEVKAAPPVTAPDMQHDIPAPGYLSRM
jgi:nitroimidazol reductase NimA-like FMN-containing flavoprotein (pyridoxamine 5'-phosphate oxidase superfamily)